GASASGRRARGGAAGASTSRRRARGGAAGAGASRRRGGRRRARRRRAAPPRPGGSTVVVGGAAVEEAHGERRDRDRAAPELPSGVMSVGSHASFVVTRVTEIRRRGKEARMAPPGGQAGPASPRLTRVCAGEIGSFRPTGPALVMYFGHAYVPSWRSILADD